MTEGSHPHRRRQSKKVQRASARRSEQVGAHVRQQPGRQAGTHRQERTSVQAMRYATAYPVPTAMLL